MKQNFNTVMLALALILLGVITVQGRSSSQPTKADTSPEKRSIHTFGSSKVVVSPDCARLHCTITSEAATVKETREENAKHFANVKKALEALKISQMMMKTSNARLEQVYDRDSSKPKLVGYRAVLTFTVLLKDKSPETLSRNATLVTDTVLEHGVNAMDGITYFVEDEAAAKREALTKAVEDAVQNAKALAGGVKSDVVVALSIADQPRYERHEHRMLQNARWDATTAPAAQFVAGDIVIQCDVSVQCKFGS